MSDVVVVLGGILEGSADAAHKSALRNLDDCWVISTNVVSFSDRNAIEMTAKPGSFLSN